MPYASSDVLAVRVKSEGGEGGSGEGGRLGRLEVDLCIQPRGEHYSNSRGEQYARLAELGRGNREQLYERSV